MGSDIPAHLAKVRDTEWYVAFMEKYSAYPIEMHLNDELWVLSSAIWISLRIRQKPEPAMIGGYGWYA